MQVGAGGCVCIQCCGRDTCIHTHAYMCIHVYACYRHTHHTVYQTNKSCEWYKIDTADVGVEKTHCITLQPGAKLCESGTIRPGFTILRLRYCLLNLCAESGKVLLVECAPLNVLVYTIDSFMRR